MSHKEVRNEMRKEDFHKGQTVWVYLIGVDLLDS